MPRLYFGLTKAATRPAPFAGFVLRQPALGLAAFFEEPVAFGRIENLVDVLLQMRNPRRVICE